MKPILFLLLLFAAFQSFGQRISGTVVDSTGKAVPTLDVLVYNEEGVLQDLVSTDEAGAFSVALATNGNYVLTIYNMGEQLFSRKLEVNGDVVENVSLNRTVDLEGVTVTAIRPLIVNKIDRLVYNVENSVYSNGMDALAVLARTPMVVVSEMGISIAGKSSVSIMIDDRLLNLSGTELMNYLRSIRSDDIASIEVITAPPAKYQAEGNSGIINIVFKKDPSLGWTGYLSAAYIQTTYAGISDNATLAFRSKKLSTALRLRHFDRAMRATEDIDIIGTTSVLSYDERKDLFNGYGGNFTLDYQLTKRIRSGLIYDAGQINNNMIISNSTEYQTSGMTDSTLNTYSVHKSPAFSHTLNVYADIALDTNGKNLSVVGNYFSNMPSNTVDFNTLNPATSAQQQIRNTSNIDYAIWSVQADYYQPAKWITTEAGVKYTHFDNRSDVSYLNYSGGAFVIDTSKSNTFSYEEQNMAAYLSFSRNFGKKWSSKAGVRYEYSTIDGFSPTTGERTLYEYSQFFPTAYVGFQANEKNYLSVNYSKRINRPPFSMLNPFRWYANPYTYFTGNPLLRPSFNHNAELAYNYGGFLIVSVYGQRQVNGFGRTVELVNGGQKVVNYDNYLTSNAAGINVSFYHAIKKWWEVYISANGSYSESRSSNADILAQNGFSAYYSIDNSLVLHADKQVRGMVSFWHALPARQGNGYSQSIAGLSAGVRFPFAKERFQANIFINDVLRTSVSRGKLYFNDFEQTYTNYYDARSLTISITYSFGNRNVQEKTKEINFEEKYRGT